MRKFHPSQTIKTMLFQASHCWLTWCLSPWKQAHWRGVRVSSWVEIRNRWRLSVHHAVSVLYEVRGSLTPTAIVFNLLEFDDFLVKSRNAQCVFWLKKKHLGTLKHPFPPLPLEKQIMFFDSMQLLSLYGRDTDCVTELRDFTWAPSISIYRSRACMKARSGLDWEAIVERPSICHHLGDNLSDWKCSLTDLSLCFELITKLCVCATVLRRGVRREKWQRWGNREKQGFWVKL